MISMAAFIAGARPRCIQRAGNSANCNWISAARAYEIGLVNAVVPRDQLRAGVDALLADLKLCAPLSVASAKSAIERGHGRSLDEGLQIERECYDVTLFSEDRDEGLAAFAEGRPPRYQGR